VTPAGKPAAGATPTARRPSLHRCAYRLTTQQFVQAILVSPHRELTGRGPVRAGRSFVPQICAQKITASTRWSASEITPRPCNQCGQPFAPSHPLTPRVRSRLPARLTTSQERTVAIRWSPGKDHQSQIARTKIVVMVMCAPPSVHVCPVITRSESAID